MKWMGTRSDCSRWREGRAQLQMFQPQKACSSALKNSPIGNTSPSRKGLSLKLNSTKLSKCGSRLEHMVPIYLMAVQIFDRL